MAALQILLYFIWLYLLIRVIRQHYFFRSSGITPNTLTTFFLLKVLAGITLTLIYTYYYTDKTKSDIWRYFTDSVIINKLFFTHPNVWLQVISGWGINEPEVFKHLLSTQNFSHPKTDFVTNNAFIIRTVSVLNLLTACSLYINTLLFSFLSFVGLTALYKAFAVHFSKFIEALYISIYLVPSVVFWSSGLLKDALIFFSLGLLLYSWMHPCFATTKRIFCLLLFMAILALTKVQVLIMALPLMLLLPTPFICIDKKWIMAMLVSYTLAVFALRETILSLLCNRRIQFIELGMQEQAGSLFSTTTCSNTNPMWLTIHGFWDGTLQPYFWHTTTFMNTLAGIENWLFLGSFLLVALKYFSAAHIKYRIAVFCVAFSIINLTIIGTTVPIAGALVHYRTLSVPFILIGLLSFVNLEKFKCDIFQRIHPKK